jgi:hypothetical protein
MRASSTVVCVTRRGLWVWRVERLNKLNGSVQTALYVSDFVLRLWYLILDT